MMEKLPHIEIILPVFNEAKNIGPLLGQIKAATDSIKNEATVSLLFINDGSTDDTQSILLQHHRQRDDIRIIQLIHNFGHGAAIACGMDHFRGDIALLMDADLQDNPLTLAEMFAKWKKGVTTVVAERRKRKETAKSLFHLFYFLLHKSAKSIPPIKFGTHCLLDKSVVHRLRTLEERNRYFPGLVSFASESIDTVRVDRESRHTGKSKVGFFGLIHLAITALVSFSAAPVRLVSAIGICTSVMAFLGAISIVSIKIFTDRAIPGWASMMTTIAFGSGIQLLCLGIIGEYIARIYEEVKKRPLYLVAREYPDLASHRLPQKIEGQNTLRHSHNEDSALILGN